MNDFNFDSNQQRRSHRRQRATKSNATWTMFIVFAVCVGIYWLIEPVTLLQQTAHNTTCLAAVGIAFVIAFAMEASKRC